MLGRAAASAQQKSHARHQKLPPPRVRGLEGETYCAPLGVVGGDAVLASTARLGWAARSAVTVDFPDCREQFNRIRQLVSKACWKPLLLTPLRSPYPPGSTLHRTALLADLDELGRQTAQAPILGDLGLDLGHGVGRDDLGHRLALDPTRQGPARPVTSLPLWPAQWKFGLPHLR